MIFSFFVPQVFRFLMFLKRYGIYRVIGKINLSLTFILWLYIHQSTLKIPSEYIIEYYVFEEPVPG
jgi:hypothetical protein